MMMLFFEQKRAYEMRISDWSSDVCSSDLVELAPADVAAAEAVGEGDLVDCGISGVARFFQGVAGRGDREQAAARGDELAVLFRRARLDDEIGRASCRERVCQYV